METPELRCLTCKKLFGKKSSLLRHVKICFSPHHKSRQKSCAWCAATKSKCDLQWPSCGRCLSRNSSCEYKHLVSVVSGGSDSSRHGVTDDPLNCLISSSPKSTRTGVFESRGSVEVLPIATYASGAVPNTTFSPSTPLPLNHTSDTSNSPGSVSFATMVAHFGEGSEGLNHAEIKHPSLSPDNWHHNVVPIEAPRSPLGKHSMRFSFRILRTWPHMMSREGQQQPPIFHHTQIMRDSMATPLAHCHTIAKMWEDQPINSIDLVRDTITREMTRLFQNYTKFGDVELLASLQAVGIYLIILLFPVKDIPSSISIVEMAILSNVQRMVNYVGSQGLVLTEETEHSRPSWKSWINITSRRRAVFTLYLIHWTLSAYYGLPSFDCQELKHMPAPAPRLLWQADNKEDWESHYNRWLSDWARDEYRHGEISEIGEAILMDGRSEKWLREADDLGLFIMSLGEMVNIERESRSTVTFEK